MKKTKQWEGILLVIVLIIGCVALTSAAAQTAPSKAAYNADWDKIVEAAKKEGVINAYGYGFTGDRGKLLEETFGKRYGIKINPVSALSAQLVEKIKTEHAVNQIVCDMTQITPLWTATLDKEKLLQGVASRLPELNTAPKDVFKFPIIFGNGNWVSMTGTQMGVVVNKNLVPPEMEPRSWYDLLDPKWSGKIVVSSPKLDNTPYRLYFALKKMGKDPDDFFTRLGKNKPIIEQSIFTAFDAVAKGNASLMLMGSFQLSGEKAIGGAPVKMAYLDEGYIWMPGGNFAMTRGSTHPNATLVFINWSLTKEGVESISPGFFDSPVRADVRDFIVPSTKPDKVPSKLWQLTVEEELQIVEMSATGKLETLMGVTMPK